jgi:hypothetical protein
MAYVILLGAITEQLGVLLTLQDCMREMPELLCFLGLSRVLQGNAGVLP